MEPFGLEMCLQLLPCSDVLSGHFASSSVLFPVPVFESTGSFVGKMKKIFPFSIFFKIKSVRNKLAD